MYEDPYANVGNQKSYERQVYNGKRTRKHIERRSVDYSAPLALYRRMRYVYPRAIDLPSISGRRNDAIRQMLPPIAWEFNPTNAIASKFFHTSINQERHPINVVKWTPDGRRLLTGASSGEFTLWNGFSFNFETILQAHPCSVRCMEWTHNGNWMVSGDKEGNLKYWQNNMNNVHELKKAHEAGELRDVTFAPGDRKFATCSNDGTIKIWDFNSGAAENTLHGHLWDVRCLHWHYNKALLFSGSKDSRVKIWDPKSGTCFQTLHGHKSAISQLRINRNGNFLATASRDHLVKVWDIRMMKELRTLKRHTSDALSVQWHPVHENMLVSGGHEGSIVYWDCESEEPLAVLEGAHESSVFSLDWHPIGHILCSGSNDHHTKFWIRHRPGDELIDKAPPNRFSSGGSNSSNAGMAEMGFAPRGTGHSEERRPFRMPGGFNHNMEGSSSSSASSLSGASASGSNPSSSFHPHQPGFQPFRPYNTFNKRSRGEMFGGDSTPQPPSTFHPFQSSESSIIPGLGPNL